MSEMDNNAAARVEETVVIDGATGETIITITEESAGDQTQDAAASTTSSSTAAAAAEAAPSPDTGTDATSDPAAEQGDDVAGDNLPASGPSAVSPRDEAVYTIRLLTAVAIGSVVEGADQLLQRLNLYQQDLQQALEQSGEDGEIAIDEDEFDRLRYATIGLIFDTQNIIGRSLVLSAQAAETTLDLANTLTRPLRNFFLFRPLTRRVEQRFDNVAESGQDRISQWIDIGRKVEPRGRLLATKTYEEIVDEFINRLAENPEVKELVAEQSIGLAAGMRDEVRERTVTSDNVLEDIARRILRREPRPELAQPPPQVQRWAGVSIDDVKERELEKFDEQRNDSAE